MINQKNIHLWLIGGASFLGVAYGQIRPVFTAHAASAPSTDVSALSADALEEARALYGRRCGACHSVDANRIGPRHRGVFGREAGSLEDYDYSDALRGATFAWDDEKLDQWLADPEATVPGQKMGYRLGDPEERKLIIGFLKTQTE